MVIGKERFEIGKYINANALILGTIVTLVVLQIISFIITAIFPNVRMLKLGLGFLIILVGFSIYAAFRILHSSGILPGIGLAIDKKILFVWVLIFILVLVMLIKIKVIMPQIFSPIDIQQQLMSIIKP